jgi:hypothetical protein
MSCSCRYAGWTDSRETSLVVDIGPWVPLGNYTGVVVENNTINGGFATGVSTAFCLS